jgi:LPXTG-motif cell wall-anchored protein
VFDVGSKVTLPECTLPNTGGRSTPVLPYAVGLIALGAAVVWFTRRRRTACAV